MYSDASSRIHNYAAIHQMAARLGRSHVTLSTINIVVFLRKNVLHKCFMVYFPFQITDSYISISFL